MRVLLAGDVHGEPGWIKVLCREAIRNECSWIVQLGDFGVFPAGWSRVFLDETAKHVGRYGLSLVTVLGNHDAWPLVREQYPANGKGWGQLRDDVYWVERGTRWDWDGVSFLALGGAYSIDQEWRTAGVDWWPEELITDADVARSVAGGPVDVMLTHDSPAGVNVLGSHHEQDYLFFPEAEANRKRILRVVKATRPRYLFHGHYHLRISDAVDVPFETDGELGWHHTQVEGYDKSGRWGENWGIFDTDVAFPERRSA